MLKEIGGPAPDSDPEPINVAAKNVILMIGDGMGFKHVEATRNYVGHQLTMETLPLHLACTTYPSGGSYNSALASTTFSYLNSGYTDSAAAATALATGNKTASGRISVNTGGTSRLTSITEHVRAFSKARGVVTTVPFSHATPAGFGAHNNDRGNVTAIAREMIMGIGDGTGAWGNTPTLDVVIGGGRNTGYIGSTEYNALKNGTTGQGWTFVERQTGVDGGQAILNASQSATKLFGLFGDGGEDLPYRLADGSGYTLENPNLAEMSIAAINVLSKDPDGFFLMVEGGAIDHGSHNNNINVVIGETIDFDDAVAAVINWINTNDPDWSETLLIVTADHETGYLTKGSGILPNVPLGNPGVGILPNSTHFAWNSGNHTNSIVPVFAKGAGSTILDFYANKHDLLYNIDYLDNTDIFKTICRVMTNPKTLAEARSSESNEMLSIYNAVVTASYDDAFWVERADRSAGIKVISSAKPVKGKKVDIIGRIVKENREVAILATSVVDAGVRDTLPPVGITGKVAAELDKSGATAQGMLVKVAGIATALTRDVNNKINGYFLDDGAGLAGNGTNKGLYVMLDPNGDNSASIEGTFIEETGPLTVVEMNGNPLPAIRGMAKAPANFTAYNDCCVASGDPTYNITTHTLGANNECLMDYDTGLDLSVRVSMVNSSNFSINSGNGGNCNTGSDANNVFGGKVGLAGVINYTTANIPAWMELDISGLDPNGRYEFVTTANRAESTYSTRITKFSILDAVEFTNTSTVAAGTLYTGPTDPTVLFSTGYNNVGYVARWTNIKPTAGGTFRIRAENYMADGRAYGLSAFRLRRLQ
jgi:alkaline phosphatase